MNTELTAAIIGAVVGAVVGGGVSYFAGLWQSRRDRAQTRAAAATGLLIELRWCLRVLPELKKYSPKPGVVPEIPLNTPLLDAVGNYIQHFKPDTVEPLLIFGNLIRDIRDRIAFVRLHKGSVTENLWAQVCKDAANLEIIAAGTAKQLLSEGGQEPVLGPLPDLDAFMLTRFLKRKSPQPSTNSSDTG